MTSAAASDHPAVSNRRLGAEHAALGGGSILETVETGERSIVPAIELAEHQAGRGADRRDSAAGGEMGLHLTDEGLAASKILGAGHATGEYHHVTVGRAVMVDIDLRQEIFDTYHETVGGSHKGLIAYCNQICTDSATAENVESRQSFDILEAVGKENIDTFHIANIRKNLVNFAYFKWKPMEEKKLYPMKFCTLQDTYDWGSETFKIADLGYRDTLVREGWLAGNSISEIMDMYVDQVVGENVFAWWGRQFPVCIRQLKVSGKMPLRVNPDDETAGQRWDFLGKEKLWYVVRCGRDAQVMIGWRKDTDASEVWEKCLDGTVGDILNVVAPHAGQVLRIAPGTPHAAAGDIEILEIGESSPLDFCMCGWGREVSEEEFDPALEFVDALDFIGYGAYRDATPAPERSGVAEKLVTLPQFEVSRIKLMDPLRFQGAEEESFVLYSCISGEASIRIEVAGAEASFALKAGETMLVPADCPDFLIVPEASGTVLLETTVPYRTEQDAYINPEAAEAVEAEEA